MTTSRLQDVISDYRARLLAQENAAVQEIERAYAVVLKTIQPALNNLYRQISEKQKAGEAIPPSFLYEERRLEAIKQLISYQIDHFSALSFMKTGQMLYSSASLGIEAAQALLKASLPKGISWSFGIPHPDAITRLVGSLQDGSPLARLFRSFGLEAARNAVRALVTGLTLGWNPRRIAPLVERALNVPRWRALTIARQESLRSYRSANIETFKSNSDICSKWRWTAALQKRTCLACIAMDGTLHDLTEEFGSHVRCRCTPVPLTKSWDDLLSPLGIDASEIPDTRPNMKSGTDWFEELNDATQKDMLGNKYDAWKSGQFRLFDLVGHSHDKEWGHSIHEKSLKQLIKEHNASIGDEHTQKLPKIHISDIDTTKLPIVSHEEKLQKQYPHTQFDFKGVDTKVMPKIAKQVKLLFDDYPDVAKHVHYIGTGKNIPYDPKFVPKNLAVTTVNYPNKKGFSSILLNPLAFGDKGRMDELFEIAKKKHWFAGDYTPESMISHEFGHSVYRYLETITDHSFLGFINDFGGEGSIEAILDQFMMTNKGYGDKVSGYSKAGGPMEAWAEAFSSLYHGDKISPYAEKQRVLLNQIFPSSDWKKVEPSDMTPAQKATWRAFCDKYILMR